jgi:hypothetical protein
MIGFWFQVSGFTLSSVLKKETGSELYERKPGV